MKKGFLFLVCLCAGMVFTSQQVLADYTLPVEQTGIWRVGTQYGGLQTDSTNSPDGDGSWYFRQTSAGPLVSAGSSYDGTYTYFNFTGSGGGAGILTFKIGTNTYSADMTSGNMYLTYVYSGYYNPLPENFMYELSTYDTAGSGTIIGHPDNIITTSSHGYFTTLPGDPMEGVITSVSNSITGPPIPIPAALWLFGSGLLGLLGIRKKFIW